MFKMNSMNQVTIDADIFVIPNGACRIDQFLSESTQERFRKDIAEIAELNGLEFDPNDKLVELWWTERSDDEDHCDNLCRHTFEFSDENGNIVKTARLDCEHIPHKWLKNLKEGETMELIVPIVTMTSGYTAKVSVRANQKDYRYGRFGNFEEVVSDVCAR